jgi:hypothetical protein
VRRDRLDGSHQSVRFDSPTISKSTDVDFFPWAACVSGTVCTELNEWYFQCLPGTATTTVSTTPPTSTSSAPTSTASAPVQTGFVKTSGTKFTLNGAPYTLFGYGSFYPALCSLISHRSVRTRIGWLLGATAPPTSTRLSPTLPPAERPPSGISRPVQIYTVLFDIIATQNVVRS